MAEFLFSAAARQSYQQCPRAWVQRVQGDGAGWPATVVTWPMRMGVILHAQRHRWFKHGEPPKHPAAVCGLDALPAPGPRDELLSEHYFRKPLAGVGAVTGRIDLVDLSNPEHPRVFDHKFTRSLRRCRPLFNGDEFVHQEHNHQLIVYGAFVLREFAPAAKQLTFEEHYAQFTGTPCSDSCGATVHREHLLDLWDDVRVQAAAMADAIDEPCERSEARPSDLCDTCPLAAVCDACKARNA